MATEDYKQTMQELYTNYVELRKGQESTVTFTFKEYVENYWKFEEYHYTTTDEPEDFLGEINEVEE